MLVSVRYLVKLGRLEPGGTENLPVSGVPRFFNFSDSHSVTYYRYRVNYITRLSVECLRFFT